MSFKIDKDNYDSFKKVLGIIWHHIYKNVDSKLQTTMSGLSPVETLNKWEIEISKSSLYSGLKQALADAVTLMNYSPPKLVADINAELITNNLPNVQKLKGLVLDSVHKVAKRQKIKNNDEYYIIKELIDDNVSDISEDERKLFVKLMVDFEKNTTTG